ncbi:MAG: hypothetical protein DDT19_01560 [Syntrophomonadaceae bacterium]|nr:hypothetical protein [Bacillota bacterium]
MNVQAFNVYYLLQDGCTLITMNVVRKLKAVNDI